MCDDGRGLEEGRGGGGIEICLGGSERKGFERESSSISILNVTSPDGPMSTHISTSSEISTDSSEVDAVADRIKSGTLPWSLITRTELVVVSTQLLSFSFPFSFAMLDVPIGAESLLESFAFLLSVLVFVPFLEGPSLPVCIAAPSALTATSFTKFINWVVSLFPRISGGSRGFGSEWRVERERVWAFGIWG